RLLPTGRSHDHDRVDPVRGLEALEALGEQRPVAKLRERLRAVASEPLASTCCNENCPDGHQRGAPVELTRLSNHRVSRTRRQSRHVLLAASQATPRPSRSPRPAGTSTAQTATSAGPP